MVLIKTEFTLKGNTKLFDIGMTSLLTNAVKRTTDATLKDIKEKAIEIYTEKRITDKLPSMIIDSFSYEKSKKAAMYTIVGIVFAGGSKAPHAVYLEHDRKLRNGKMWSSVNPKAPYKFMEGGLRYGATTIKGHFNREMKKIGGV